MQKSYLVCRDSFIEADILISLFLPRPPSRDPCHPSGRRGERILDGTSPGHTRTDRKHMNGCAYYLPPRALTRQSGRIVSLGEIRRSNASVWQPAEVFRSVRYVPMTHRVSRGLRQPTHRSVPATVPYPPQQCSRHGKELPRIEIPRQGGSQPRGADGASARRFTYWITMPKSASRSIGFVA